MEDDDSFEVIEMDEEEAKSLQKNYEEQVTNNMNRYKAYQIENWYPNLKQFTFQTEFIDLNIQEAQCILDLNSKKEITENQKIIKNNILEKINRSIKRIKTSHFFIRLSTRSPKDVSYDFLNPDRKQKTVIALKEKLKQMSLNKSELNRRKDLYEENLIYEEECNKNPDNQNDLEEKEESITSNQGINGEKNENQQQQKGLMSLSGRNRKSIYNIKQNKKKTLIKNQNDPTIQQYSDLEILQLITNEEANEIFQFIQNYSKNFLKLNNSEDALQLLIESDRIAEDLQNLLIQKRQNTQNLKDSEKLCFLCLREWRDFNWQDEFRCFFYKNKLTAISQYEEDTYTEDLNQPSLQQAIGNTIQQAFNQIQPHLPFDKGVMDFVILKKDELFMLEVNPFQDYSGNSTRSAMFSWQQDMDILTNGPLQFRVLSYVKNNICNDWLPNYGTPSKTGAHLVLIQAIKEILELMN